MFTVSCFAAAIVFMSSASASESVNLFSSTTNPGELTDGVYNIVNRESGQYLDVYDKAYDDQGKAYLYKQTKQNGQDFQLEQQDDGTYIIYPQSESGIYSLCYSSDIMEGELIRKSETAGEQSKFAIIPKEENGKFYYTIKPVSMNDDKLALGVSSLKSHQNLIYAGIAVESENAKQTWEFVKVSSEKLTISGGYVNVKLGSTHEIYSKLTPEHLIGNMVWESSNPEIATVDQFGVVYGVAEGETTITVTCGTKSASTVVKVTALSAYTWYSQHNMLNGGWYGEPLKNIYFTTYGGARKRFIVQGYNNNLDWMDEGCKLCAEAMVLHNMGATLTEGYDIRTGKENNLEADPYTVGLANAGASGYNVSGTRVPNNPVLISHKMIAPRFTVDGKAIEVESYYGRNLKHIKELLDEHPEGVVVGFYNARLDTSHYLVFTECLNPDNPYGNYEFRVCDSATMKPSNGDNVPFKESISYRSLSYTYACITGYSVYNVIE